MSAPRRRGGRGNRPRPRSGPAPMVDEVPIDLVVGEPAHGGACVARDAEGRVVFVRHALPGERVRARVTRRRQRLMWADAVEVLEASPDRVESVWPQAGPLGIGGGELAHVRPEAQRRWKTSVIAGQVRRIGGEGLAAALADAGGVKVLPAPGDKAEGDLLLGRRARVEFVVDDEGRPAMHRHHDHHLMALTSLPVADPRIAASGVIGSHSQWSEVLRAGDRVRVVAPTGGDEVFVVTPRGLWTPGEGGVPRRLGGGARARWRVDALGRTEVFEVRPGGFWQTHREAAGVLARAVMDAAGDIRGASVVELYSGAGLLSRFLADACGRSGRLLTVEGDEEAVADAAYNLDGRPWVEPFVGAVDAEAVASLAEEAGARPDLVVLDPPRAGAGVEVCEELAVMGAPRVVLVSCDPAAGARDLAVLCAAGYRLVSLRAWDLFPHTHHVESVALLERV